MAFFSAQLQPWICRAIARGLITKHPSICSSRGRLDSKLDSKTEPVPDVTKRVMIPFATAGWKTGRLTQRRVRKPAEEGFLVGCRQMNAGGN
jgi:hypothetical protein